MEFPGLSLFLFLYGDRHDWLSTVDPPATRQRTDAHQPLPRSDTTGCRDQPWDRRGHLHRWRELRGEETRLAERIRIRP